MESGNANYRSAETPAEILPADTVVNAALRTTYAHWQRLKGARAMPARNEIVPKDLKHALRALHLYDVLDGGADFRMRLVGTGVFPGLDADQTGKLISEHPDPGIRLRFVAALRHVVETGQPARSLSLRKTGDLLRDAYAEGLWLPFGDGHRVEHVLAQSALTTLEPGSKGFGATPDGPARTG